jgi:plastocyanin
MADTIKNPTDLHAVIVFEEGEVKMVVPDEIWASPGQSVQWIVVPPNNAKVIFDIEDTPIDWESDPRDQSRIKGRVRREARGEYKYSVSDGAGNTIDPRLRVKR